MKHWKHARTTMWCQLAAQLTTAKPSAATTQARDSAEPAVEEPASSHTATLRSASFNARAGFCRCDVPQILSSRVLVFNILLSGRGVTSSVGLTHCPKHLCPAASTSAHLPHWAAALKDTPRPKHAEKGKDRNWEHKMLCAAAEKKTDTVIHSQSPRLRRVQGRCEKSGRPWPCP